MIQSLRLAIIFGCIVFCYSCQSGQTENNTASIAVDSEIDVSPIDFDLKAIQRRGYITAVVDYSSTSYFVYKGALMGFEYELLKRIEKYLDVEVKIIVEPSIKKAVAMLNKGEVDLMAYPLTITKERKKVIGFADHYITQRQVLVQKKPDNWRTMKLHVIEKSLIRDQVDLINTEIHVLNNSSYIDALEALSIQIGGDITILEDDASVDTEELIRRVAVGQYRYTVSDENIAKVNMAYYPNLDVGTPVSFPRRVSWAVRLNAGHLLDTLNIGLKRIKSGPIFNTLYKKYFGSARRAKRIAASDYSSFTGQKLSPYDDLIKMHAKELGWDWRLLASLVYQESKFDPRAKSWAGAQGLLQLMPATAKEHGVKNRADPVQSLKGGSTYLMSLENYWKPEIENYDDLVRFVMSSYNVGMGHLQDARALTRKHGGNDTDWNEVSEYLLKLSNKTFYQDAVVRFGYARGSEPVNYVSEIFDRYSRYEQLIH